MSSAKVTDRTALLNFHEDEEMAMENEKQTQSKNGTCNPIKLMLPDHMKNYWKTVLLAFFLLISGLSFLIIATYIVFLPDSMNGPHSYVFFLCGFICFIPGGYHVIYIYFASKGKEGYKLEDLPTFTDD
ncbi:transmembrane protein 230-like [Clytia hemisphaerica]|uniref:transmembrane protein 230-like n=1 Tax=Clytia hemisphaerica TaxID=252671 RepID=UPI0034D4504B